MFTKSEKEQLFTDLSTLYLEVGNFKNINIGGIIADKKIESNSQIETFIMLMKADVTLDKINKNAIVDDADTSDSDYEGGLLIANEYVCYFNKVIKDEIETHRSNKLRSEQSMLNLNSYGILLEKIEKIIHEQCKNGADIKLKKDALCGNGVPSNILFNLLIDSITQNMTVDQVIKNNKCIYANNDLLPQIYEYASELLAELKIYIHKTIRAYDMSNGLWCNCGFLRYSDDGKLRCNECEHLESKIPFEGIHAPYAGAITDQNALREIYEKKGGVHKSN